ncbi:hypothetical protein FI667_g16966, partial [Globisporangium splendens]
MAEYVHVTSPQVRCVIREDLRRKQIIVSDADDDFGPHRDRRSLSLPATQHGENEMDKLETTTDLGPSRTASQTPKCTLPSRNWQTQRVATLIARRGESYGAGAANQLDVEIALRISRFADVAI